LSLDLLTDRGVGLKVLTGEGAAIATTASGKLVPREKWRAAVQDDADHGVWLATAVMGRERQSWARHNVAYLIEKATNICPNFRATSEGT
jgi:hypothetical protein